MNIKQKLNYFAISIGLISLVAIPVISVLPVHAACGGVQTSIISCTQTGTCADGSGNALYEGSDPANDKKDPAKAAIAYKAKYGHNYGFCKDGSTPTKGVESTGLWGLLLMAINILTAGIGILAVAGIVYGAILYTSAGGSADQVKKARGVITNVVIGIVAYALMYSLLNFIIPGGLFKP